MPVHLRLTPVQAASSSLKLAISFVALTLACLATAGAVAAPAEAAGPFKSVSAGDLHSCGVKADDTLACWGANGDGQATPPAGSFKSVSAGLYHSCGVKTDDTLVCWGENGDGQATPPAGPFKSVSAGGYHACGVKADDTIACWGYNVVGQATPPAGSYKSVSAGLYHSCGVKTDDTLACWGFNDSGQATPPAGSFKSVSAGGYHSCGVKADDTLACWGANGDGQATPPAGSFKSVSAGYLYSCGVKADDTLACWGFNTYGVTTPPAGSFKSVSAGRHHSCGVKTDDTIACWGNNGDGQSTPPNQPPTADAGPDQTVDSAASVGLDGTGSSDPDAGDTLDYTWTQTAGPSVSLTGADTATPSFTAPIGPTTLTFELEVCDGEPLCDTDTVVIAVNPEDPGAAPIDLSTAGQSAQVPQVAIDADGDAVFTWQRSDGTNDRIQARAWAANGTLSAVQTLSGAGQDASNPQVAINADGDALFTWTRLDGTSARVQARARAADGTLSAVQTLSGVGQHAGSPQVAIDADGDAVFTWYRSDGANTRVQARARAANGALSAVQTLSGAGQDAFSPQVAIDADGDAVFTWTRYDGANFRVQARARAANGTLSAVQTLSGAGQGAFIPEVAIDADGDAAVTWSRFDGTEQRVQARARAAAGTLSPVQTLSGAGQHADSPQVAIDADGDAAFTWQRSDGANTRVQARARAANGALSAVQTLSGAGQDASSPQVAIDADGDAVFTWQRSDGTSDRIQARARAANGALSAVQTLSGAGQNASNHQVAIDADGDAAFTWQRSNESEISIVQAAFGP